MWLPVRMTHATEQAAEAAVERPSGHVLPAAFGMGGIQDIAGDNCGVD